MSWNDIFALTADRMAPRGVGQHYHLDVGGGPRTAGETDGIEDHVQPAPSVASRNAVASGAPPAVVSPSAMTTWSAPSDRQNSARLSSLTTTTSACSAQALADGEAAAVDQPDPRGPVGDPESRRGGVVQVGRRREDDAGMR
ncbi:hypothetical protein [Mycobacterium tilburgii]|uniref:hypothetical protein n=1 Tax=Mycobacterium tilburgii TaxID=44467 RepID=UPI001184127E|nr:hypothetical protein [Mycobacterium tilburgii]